jgi:hypothetical protein
MARSRFQFRLSTLLWIMLAVACWFGGMAVQRRFDEEELRQNRPSVGSKVPLEVDRGMILDSSEPL